MPIAPFIRYSISYPGIPFELSEDADPAADTFPLPLFDTVVCVMLIFFGMLMSPVSALILYALVVMASPCQNTCKTPFCKE